VPAAALFRRARPATPFFTEGQISKVLNGGVQEVTLSEYYLAIGDAKRMEHLAGR
jgi:hypothetical protein